MHLESGCGSATGLWWRCLVVVLLGDGFERISGYMVK